MGRKIQRTGARSTLLALILLAAVGAGCGGDGDGASASDQVREAADNFVDAMAAESDADCGDLTHPQGEVPDAVDAVNRLGAKLGQELRATCGITGDTTPQFRNLEIDQVSVEGDQATVSFVGSSTRLHLEDEDGHWLVTKIR